MMKVNKLVWLTGISGLALVTSPNAAVAQTGAATAQATSAADASVDDIMVLGIRRSLETAQAVKQNADQIVDSVVAEDIGKLPDQTAAESLARITGVQVDRSGGEAAGVRVRGLPDLTTTYNGRELFTADGRSVALQDFPSASIARIDVFKSGSANLVEAGIAGEIDVRSRKPFDFKGDRIAGGVGGLHWYQSQRLGLDANLLISKRWDTGIGEMGFLIEGSYADIKFLDASRTNSQQMLVRTNVPGYIGQSLRLPSAYTIEYPNADRWRPSAAAAFQWRPDHRLEIYADFLFQGFRADGAPRSLLINTGPASILSNATLFPDTNLIKTVTAIAGGFPVGSQTAIDATTDTYQGGVGFIWKGDRVTVTGDAAISDSTFSQDARGFNFSTRTQPTRTFDFDTSAGVGGSTVLLSGIDLFNPANYRMTGFNENGVRNHGHDIQARLDVDYKLNRFGLTNLQAGVRFNKRTADAMNYSRSAVVSSQTLFFPTLPLEYQSATPGFRNDDALSTRTFVTPTRDSILANLDTLRGYAGLSAGTPALASVYTGEEKGYAAYLQARYDFSLGGIDIDGLVGLRAIRTEDLVQGIQRVTTGGVTTTTPITLDTNYTDFLPNVSARIHLSQKLQLRLAFTETRTRPAFGALNPSTTILAPSVICNTDPTSSECVRIAVSGNPALRPIQSKNYDASLEWYFNRSGGVSIGLFQRDIEGFISNFTADVPDSQYGVLRLTRPVNGQQGRIRGVEVGARTFLRAPWLPDFLRDFGVFANYTYLENGAVLAQDLAATLPGVQRLQGVSKHLVNLSGFYENRWVSLRMSYNYRSDFVAAYSRVADPGLPGSALGPTLPTTEDGRGTVDLNASLNPIDNVTLSFSITNLTGAASTNRRAFNAAGQSYPFQARFLESVYRLGLRFRL